MSRVGANPLWFPILGMLSGIGALSIDMYLPAFPAIAMGLGVDETQVQVTLSLFLIGFAVGQALHGPLSDRFGRKPVILGGLCCYCLASAGCALSADVEQLYLARWLQGLAGAAGSVLARAVIRDRYSGEALARAMSWLMLIMSAAPMLAPLIGSLMLDWLGWRSIFWTLALFSGVWLLLIGYQVPETLPPDNRRSLRPAAVLGAFLSVLKHRPAMGYALCGGLAFGGMFASITGTPFIYMGLYQVSASAYAGLFALNIIGMALGSMLNARLVGRYGRDGMINGLTTVLLLAGGALALDSYTGWGGLWGLVVPLILYVGCVGALAANCIAGTLQYFPHISGTASSLFGVLQFGLGGVAGWLVAACNDGTAFPMGITILGVAAASFTLFRLLVARPAQRLAV